MFKKITYLILLIILFIPFSTFADGLECKIANGPAPELLKYIENIRKIISNTTNELIITNNSLDAKKDYGKIKGMLIGLYNKSISWEGYYSTWNYYIIAPMTSSDIPYEIKRDHNLIEKETDLLSKYLNKITSNGTSNITIKNACKNVKTPNCDLNNMQAKDIIGELLKDTSTLANSYRLHVLGKKSFAQIKFGGNNFPQIWNYYNKKMVEVCSSKNGMLKSITDLKNTFSNINKQNEKGIQLWKDAVDLILGRDPNKYEETEKQLLKRELRNQGVDTNNTAIIMGNLKKYNSGKNGDGGYGEKNNFIGNSFKTMTENIGNQYRDFKENVFSSLQKKDPTQNKTNLKKSIKEIIDLGQKNDITTNIVTKITEIYQSQAMFSKLEDTSTQKLQGRLIDMHIQLLSAINKLDKTIPISEKVCNSQDNGRGNCSTK